MAMNHRFLRPRASSATHPEALDWASRVTANGGTVSSTTLAAVSTFCASIQAAGIRDRFYRLNLFCGDQLAAALVPLYLAESSTASVRGNTYDTNANFVSGDFNNTGPSSGLKGNGTTKYLDTGLAANSFPANNAHMGFGLRATQTGGQAFKSLGGAYNNSSNALEMTVRRGSVSNIPNCFFTRFGVLTDTAGDLVVDSSLAVGDLLMAWPSFYRNGSQSGQQATTAQDYPAAHAISIFALNNSGSPINHTDSRINWYSIGLTMTAAQALSFYNLVSTFNTSLSRT